jgi:hypothetical protein
MVTLVLALAAGEGVKGGFECDPSGVSHFNMPEKALDCIAPINPDDLRAHAADYGREMDKDSGSIWDFRMVGSSDPSREKTTFGAAADCDEQLNPGMCKYNVCQQGGAVRSLLTAAYGAVVGLAKPRKTDQQARALAFGARANARNLPGLLGVTKVVIDTTQCVLTDNDGVRCEWGKRMATMAHPASDDGELTCLRGLGIHRDTDSPYGLHALIHTGVGHTVTLFYIDGKWCALIFPAGVCGYILNRSLTRNNLHLVPAHSFPSFSTIIDCCVYAGQTATKVGQAKLCDIVTRLRQRSAAFGRTAAVTLMQYPVFPRATRRSILSLIQSMRGQQGYFAAVKNSGLSVSEYHRKMSKAGVAAGAKKYGLSESEYLSQNGKAGVDAGAKKYGLSESEYLSQNGKAGVVAGAKKSGLSVSDYRRKNGSEGFARAVKNSGLSVSEYVTGNRMGEAGQFIRDLYNGDLLCGDQLFSGSKDEQMCMDLLSQIMLYKYEDPLPRIGLDDLHFLYTHQPVYTNGQSLEAAGDFTWKQIRKAHNKFHESCTFEQGEAEEEPVPKRRALAVVEE